jgi:hypothetical protein
MAKESQLTDDVGLGESNSQLNTGEREIFFMIFLFMGCQKFFLFDEF